MFSYNVNEEIQLRLLELRHTDELFALTDGNREQLRQWLPWVDGTVDTEHTKRFIQSTLAAFAGNNGIQAGIFYKGNMAGCVGLHGIDWGNRKTSIGYWLGAEYQGHGIMTNACGTLVNYVFSELNLNRVEIRAAEFNTRSRAIPERLGFVQEGKIRQAEWLADRYVDHIVYGMLREDWSMNGQASNRFEVETDE
ncbi:GNAT family N-acetyltransferase [Paenibacillus thalictri]|uniref:N-acetyltransferase n=1 Tax=Paenibacillus thalictri TaxID=2527873 RepID=A0A4Q9DLB9_9BACL|nr:GNAT family protein [Paenibacillus thalictri]TBL74525.1 N-acetyltransferase [Paenibacillus thalictri]